MTRSPRLKGPVLQGQELVDAKEKVQAIIGSYRSEPNKTFISALDRLMELTCNLTMLQTQVALNYVDVKRTLESTNGVNRPKAGRRDESARHRQTGS